MGGGRRSHLAPRRGSFLAYFWIVLFSRRRDGRFHRLGLSRPQHHHQGRFEQLAARQVPVQRSPSRARAVWDFYGLVWRGTAVRGGRVSRSRLGRALRRLGVVLVVLVLLAAAPILYIETGCRASGPLLLESSASAFAITEPNYRR